jgi:hypothetical protein
MEGAKPAVLRPAEALGLVAAELQPAVREAMAGFRVRLEMSAAVDLAVARIESSCPPFLLIDTELLGCPADLCCFARSLRPGVKVFAVVYFWSEREDALRECADALLHKPPRRREWEGVLQRFGVPGWASALHAA